eukprot:15857-Heterococcus_DN1.PRE.3
MIEHVEVPIVKGVEPGTVLDLKAAKPKSLIQWDGYIAAERSCDTVDEKLLVVCESKLHVRPYHIDDIVTRRITMNNYMESIRRGVDAVNNVAIEQRKVLLKFADRKIVYAIGGPHVLPSLPLLAQRNSAMLQLQEQKKCCSLP